MYFNKFPLSFFTLDEYQSAQILPNIFKRVKFLDQLINDDTFYSLYDIKDGDTPEITADIFYGNPELHWIILQANEILDPRFEWPMGSFDLQNFTIGKYGNLNSIHHYEDSTGNITTNANVTIASSNEFDSFSVNDVVLNNTSPGTGVIISNPNAASITVLTTNGGFITGDRIVLSTNANIMANITATQATGVTPVTNLKFEQNENEKKRRIKVIKPGLVPDIITEFEKLIAR